MEMMMSMAYQSTSTRGGSLQQEEEMSMLDEDAHHHHLLNTANHNNTDFNEGFDGELEPGGRGLLPAVDPVIPQMRDIILVRQRNPGIFNTSYSNLLSKFKFSLTREDTASLLGWYAGLRNCVSCLNRSVVDLVELSLTLDWPRCSPELQHLVARYIVELVSANNVFGELCLNSFTLQLSQIPHHNQDDEDSPASPSPLSIPDDVPHHGIILGIVLEIIKVAPLLYEVFSSALARNFPHKRFPLPRIGIYMKNMFELALHMPRLTERVMSITVERLLLMDMDVTPLDDEDDDDDENEGAGEHEYGDEGERGEQGGEMFQMDSLDTTYVPLADSLPQASSPEKDQDTPRNRLDVLMLLAFEFITLNFEKDPQTFFDALWRDFERVVLPTHKCQFVQFFIFYAASARPHYSKLFLERLMAKVLDNTLSDTMRQGAAFYIASYCARANYIPILLVRAVLDDMTSFLFSYVRDRVFEHVDAARHVVFHVMCQAVFYILCFNAPKFAESEEGRAFLESLPIEFIVQSRLDPFSVCDESMVKQFVRTMQALRILFLAHYIRDSRRSLNNLPIAYLPTSLSPFKMEAYYPFDPYTLKKSSLYVNHLYAEWQDHFEAFDEGEDEDDNDLFDEDDDDGSQSDRYQGGTSYSDSYAGSYGGGSSSSQPPLSQGLHPIPPRRSRVNSTGSNNGGLPSFSAGSDIYDGCPPTMTPEQNEFLGPMVAASPGSSLLIPPTGNKMLNRKSSLSGVGRSRF